MTIDETNPADVIESCHVQTTELVESLDETTELLSDLADTMEELAQTYEQMGQPADTQQRHRSTTAD